MQYIDWNKKRQLSFQVHWYSYVNWEVFNHCINVIHKHRISFYMYDLDMWLCNTLTEICLKNTINLTLCSGSSKHKSSFKINSSLVKMEIASFMFERNIYEKCMCQMYNRVSDVQQGVRCTIGCQMYNRVSDVQ